MLTMIMAAAVAAGPGPVRHVETLVLPTASEGPHDWPADEISGIEYVPATAELLIVPDDRSERAPARVGRVTVRFTGSGNLELGPIRWTALLDEHGRAFPEDTVDPEAVRGLEEEGLPTRIVWASEGYAKRGIQPAIYEMNLDGTAPERWALPEVFLHDDPHAPRRGIRHNRGFESLAVRRGAGDAAIYAAVEQPLIQDEPSGVCRVLVRGPGGKARQLGYELGPDSDTAGVAELSLAELICVGPRRLLALENAETEGGMILSTLWLASADDATDLAAVGSLAEAGRESRRYMRKELLLRFSALGAGEAAGDYEAMTLIEAPDGRRLLLVAEDNDGRGGTRVLVLELPDDVGG